jgi:hypothetical protein
MLAAKNAAASVAVKCGRIDVEDGDHPLKAVVGRKQSKRKQELSE